MSRTTPRMREFAKRLLACETNGELEPSLPATHQVCDKLRSNLSKVMGNSGFRALLSRALDLSDSEVPWLRTLRTKMDGSLDGLEEIDAQIPPRQIAEGGVVLVAQLLGLMVVLIGEGLTLSLVRGVWPKLSLEVLDIPEGDQNEKKK